MAAVQYFARALATKGHIVLVCTVLAGLSLGFVPAPVHTTTPSQQATGSQTNHSTTLELSTAPRTVPRTQSSTSDYSAPATPTVPPQTSQNQIVAANTDPTDPPVPAPTPVPAPDQPSAPATTIPEPACAACTGTDSGCTGSCTPTYPTPPPTPTCGACGTGVYGRHVMCPMYCAY